MNYLNSTQLNISITHYIKMSTLNTSMIRKRSPCLFSSGTKVCKVILICVSLLLTFVYLFCFFSGHSSGYKLIEQKTFLSFHQSEVITTQINISHIFFGIPASSNTWKNRRRYLESWWRPNITRGLLFFDRPPVEHLPWSLTAPPFRVSEDNTKYRAYNKHRVPFVIRLARVIEEAFNEEEREGTGLSRWYVIADDDTIIFVDNLVEILSKYDHTKYFYIGMRSESIVSNSIMSFDMGFGGAGYALSYPLAKAVAKNMDVCIKRYPTLFGSDLILMHCISDLGISLTLERGFHQIDLHRDISGYLSAHPVSPILTLHHLDAVQPIFPSMNRYESLNHLMKAAKLDQSRLFQQSICYYGKNNWTFSVAWGYSVALYNEIVPPSVLYRPLETFIPWKKGAWPFYMFNARHPSDRLHTFYGPRHVFFFSAVDENRIMDHVVTSYAISPSSPLNSSVQYMTKIRVLSPVKRHRWLNGNRRECCDVVQLVGMDSMAIKLRECHKDEIIGAEM